METSKYIIHSTGKVIPGFELNQVIDNLTQTFTMTEGEMSELFIENAPKKIKTLESKEKAEGLCTKLHSLGLDCQISEVTQSVTQHPELTIPARVTQTTTKTHAQRQYNKWRIMFTALLLVTVVCAFMLFR